MQIESMHTGEFILSGGDKTISRDAITLAATTVALQPGTLLGKVTATNRHVPYNNAAADGSQVCTGLLYADAPVSLTAQPAVQISRDVEVNGALLTGTDAAGLADLAALNIIVR